MNWAYLNNLSYADSLYNRSLSLYEKLGILDIQNTIFNQACYWSVLEDRDQALQLLKRWLEFGSEYKFYKDFHFDSLIGDAEYESLVKDFKNKLGL